MNRNPKTKRECVDCLRVGWPGGRGLCTGCYKRHVKAGTLEDYDRVRTINAALVKDFLQLRDPSRTIKQECERLSVRLGVTSEAMERAYYRVVGRIRKRLAEEREQS